MRPLSPLSPLSMCCVALLLLESGLLAAAPAGTSQQRSRSTSLKNGNEADKLETPLRETVPLPELAPHATLKAKRTLWRSLLIRGPLARHARAVGTPRQSPRARRQAHAGTRGHHHHHAQLMRVGCVLGTCQVQNLSHRLYQLIGQSGREDSSPMNPRSPHSYG